MMKSVSSLQQISACVSFQNQHCGDSFDLIWKELSLWTSSEHRFPTVEYANTSMEQIYIPPQTQELVSITMCHLKTNMKLVIVALSMFCL